MPSCPIAPCSYFLAWRKCLRKMIQSPLLAFTSLSPDVLAQHVNRAISSFDDAAEFVKKHPDQFLRAVEDHKLLAAPGGAVGEPLSNALTNYEKQNETWRTQEWINEYNELSISGKVLNALIESITP